MKINSYLNYLVVDDFEPIRRLIKAQLESTGVKTIYEGKDGQEALDVLNKRKVDVVICDWNMPNKSGLEVLQFVKTTEQLSNIHFMFITAEAEHKSVIKAIDEGVDDFLVKPFTPSKLREKIAAMLARPPRTRIVLNRQEKTGDSQGENSTSQNLGHVSETPVVVVVDDVPANIDVIREILKEGYKVKAATSGVKALSLIQGNLPDLVLLDIMMPEMDGYEVCRQLKADINTQHIPVIFLSTKSEVVDMTRGFELGAVDYITKPVRPEILNARVKTQIQLKRARDELSYQIQDLMDVVKLREDVERMTRHDIKSPLTAILGKTDDLINSGYLQVEQKKDLETIQGAAHDMLGMINRSLDIFKMERGTYQPNLESIDLSVITLKVVNDLRSFAKKREISIKFDSPSDCFVMGEQMLCLSILGNLIKNAVEASPDGASVTVSIEQEAHEVHVLIHNMSVIPIEIRDNFFEKYVTSGKEKGTGLGTYSARLMAKVQSGDISFETDDATGTNLVFSLPISTEV